MLTLKLSTVSAQSVPCSDISFEACGNMDVIDDDCYRVAIPFVFVYTGSGSFTQFDADAVEITFSIDGNAIFDYALTQSYMSGISVNATNNTSFALNGPCVFGGYNIEFSTCNDPSALVYVIAEPGAQFEVTANVELYYRSSPFVNCEDGSDDCDEGQVDGAYTLITKNVPSACSSDLSIDILGFPSGPVSPHEEVELELKITNNGTSTITLSEVDFRIRATDVHGTLEDIGISPGNATSGNSLPPIYSEDGDEYYFYFGEFDDDVLDPSESVILLTFSILPPNGLGNLYGEAEVQLISANVSVEGGPCCSLEPPSKETIVFPGDLPCEGDLEDVEIVLRQYSGPSLEYCEIGFNIVLNSPDEWEAEKLLMEFALAIDGNLIISSVTPTGSFAGCGGCLSVVGNTITYDFDDAMNPLHISDDGSDGFRIVLDGLYGSLEDIEVLLASIKVQGISGSCIPSIVYHPSLTLPIESGCDFCSDIYIRTGDYSDPMSLDDCEGGFGINLRSPTSYDFEEIFVDFQIDNPNDLTIEVSSLLCASSNLCDPAGTGWASIDDCLAYNSTTDTYRYQYCPFGGPVTNTANVPFPLIDVKVSGMGCIPGITFLETTKLLEDGETAYCYPLDNPAGTFPICNDCPDDEYTIMGTIRTENNHGVHIDDDPDDQGIYIISDDCPALIDDIFDSYDCKEVISSGNCDGTYNHTFTCTSDDEFAIVPYKDVGYLNGVTTYDLVLISRHVLGTQLLNSPYKIIAADANGSNTVTTFDVVVIRKVILFIDNNFGPSNTSWRFIDASFTFPNPSNPFQTAFPECIQVDLSTNNSTVNQDFIAVKIGDLNNSADPCLGFAGGGVEERAQPVSLALASARDIEKGETAIFDFTVQSPEALVSWEAGLRFDPRYLQFEEALPAELDGVNAGNFGTTQADEGKLRALWVSPDTRPVPFAGGVASFRLKFKALQPIGDIRELISLDDGILQGRAYQDGGLSHPLQLAFTEKAATPTVLDLPAPGLSVTALPNPFGHELKLVINAPADDWLEVAVFAADGRKVAAWMGEILAPQRELVFQGTESWGTGTFTYRVRTSQYNASGKISRQ